MVCATLACSDAGLATCGRGYVSGTNACDSRALFSDRSEVVKRSVYLVAAYSCFALAGFVFSGCGNATTAPLVVFMVSDRDEALSAGFAERLVGRGDMRIRTIRNGGQAPSLDANVLLLDWRAAAAPSQADRGLVAKFARPGKGIVAVGGTLLASRSCPELGEQLGGAARSRTSLQKVLLTVLDPAHATTLSLGRTLTIDDAPAVVDRCEAGNNVLIRTAGPLTMADGKATDKPVPVAWTRRAASNRVFVTSLGTDDRVLENEQFVTLVHNALRWAGGRPAPIAHNVLTTAEQQVGFELLFNGRDLSGWRGTPGLWSVENGEIVGRGADLPHNVFLIHEKEYGDFLLRFSVKLINHNSGVQFRSREFPEFVVKGYQADIADQWYGSLYEEGLGRGVLANGFKDKGEKVACIDGWNDMTVKAVGPKITITLNGLTTVEFTEADATRPAKGIIALQLHKGPPMEVRFRDIRIRPLAD